MPENKVQVVIEFLRRRAGEVKRAASDLQELGRRGSEAIRKLDGDLRSFKMQMTELEGVIQRNIAAFAAFRGARFLQDAIDEAQRAEAAYTALAVTARYAGESIEGSLAAAAKLSADGLMTTAEASQALQNLLNRGFSLEQAVEMLNRLKDAAAFNRAAHLSMGEAIVTATEGLKNENSVLVDNAGVTKNVSVMWKEYAAQLGKSVADLTMAEKRQAEYNGVLRETEGQLGNAARYLQTAAGEQARMNAEAKKAKEALGRDLMPALTLLYKALSWLAKGVNMFLGGWEILTVQVSKFIAKAQAIGDAGGLVKLLFSRDARAQVRREFEAIDKAFDEQVKELLEKYSGAVKPPDIGPDPGKRRADVVLEKTEKKAKEAKRAVDALLRGFRQGLSALDLSIDKEGALAAFEEVSAKLDQFKENYLQRLRALEAGEENFGRGVKEIQRQVLEAKRRAAEQAAVAIRSQIDAAIQEERRYAEEIRRIEGALRREEETTEDALRDLQRKRMDAEQQWYDRRRQAQEKLFEAQGAVVRGEYDRARELARQARDIAKSLAAEVKVGDEVRIDEAFGFHEAEKVIREAGDLIKRAYREQRDEAEDAQEAVRQKIDRLKGEYDELQKRLEGFRKELQKLASQEFEATVRVKVEGEEKLEDIRKDTESVHTVYVRTVQTSRFGGIVRGLFRGGRIPGWGGGDRVRALLEPGEFVVRKEAVRRYGAGLFELLNSLRLSLPRIPAPALPRSQPSYATGGLVAGAPLLGRLELAFPGGESIQVFAFDREIKRLEKVLNRANKTR